MGDPGKRPQQYPQQQYPPQNWQQQQQPGNSFPAQFYQQNGPPQGYPGAQQYGGPPPQQQKPYGYPQQGGAGPSQPPPPNYDVEAAESARYAEAFRDRAVRRGFIRKVLGLVALMLLVTAGCSLVFYFVQPLKDYVRGPGHWLFWLSWGLSIAAIIALGCSQTLRYKTPYNYLFLAAFTLVFAFQIGTITSYWNTQVVLVAFVVTAAVVTGCFLIAFCTKLDFTTLGGYLGMAFLVFFVMILVGVFWIHNTIYLIIGFVGALLFSIHLIYDLQLMMAGKRVQVSPDDYIQSALSIFLDVINIFLMILTFLGASGLGNN